MKLVFNKSNKIFDMLGYFKFGFKKNYPNKPTVIIKYGKKVFMIVNGGHN